ncbi:hypothetical protein EO95_09380 [Methanosarcina sp. 1.H.T.1A.1]|uniref:hypothetical protein n=1 Tax=Methanosarcina sp. 1.H.T.1A.1 TaxID=1483602 RepID=UPI0006224921|nr:hypothetical protein [Methanosarcina sp. 1.H.T.1A.1]KKH92879.1 hypothetical protein EO95_09380 [Methanosarcina sp. 1.H.T.1A.1]
MTSPFKKCNRFSSCSVNNCPLDPEYPDRSVHEDDPEQECTCEKTYRVRIAEQFPGMLKYHGMTIKEYKNKQIVAALSEENRHVFRGESY